MQRHSNSTPATRAKNGRRRTASITINGRGTKAKQAARAKARKAAYVKRHGATPRALRVTNDTLPKFQRDQKRRRVDPIDERFTTTLLSVFRVARGGGMPPKIAPLSGPRTAPPKPVRDRTKMRAAGMRFEVGPNGRREWTYVDGTNGTPIKLGHGRVIQRRQLRRLMWSFGREVGEDEVNPTLHMGVDPAIGESVSRAAVGLE